MRPPLALLLLVSRALADGSSSPLAAKEEPKKDDSPEKDQATSAKEEPKKDESSSAPKEQPKKEEANPEPKSEYRKPDSATPAPKVPEQAKKESGKTAPESPPKQGSRNETRVRPPLPLLARCALGSASLTLSPR